MYKKIIKSSEIWKILLVSVFILSLGIIQVGAAEPGYMDASSQQQLTVTGTVADETGAPAPGVSILQKGTTIGTLTDINGKYSLPVSDRNATLVFSFVGYRSQEIPINGQAVINVSMAVDMIGLEDVVVIGYGTVKKKDLTGSVASVSEDVIAERPVARLDQAMVGSIPGLDIISSAATPGAGTSILLRGKRSFQASNDPLMILDGMPFYGNLNDINPADIKSVDVLKDASSTAIYGSRGANGVIIITTKRGTVSKPKFTLDSYAGPELRFGYIPVMNGPQYAEWAREAYRAIGGYPYEDTNAAQDAIIFDVIELPTVTSGAEGMRYQDDLLQNGFQQRHQLSVNGGSEAVKYNFSGNYFQQEGILPDDIFTRVSLNSNIDVTLSPKVTAGTSIQLSSSKTSQMSNRSAFNYAINGDPLGQLYDPSGNLYFQVNTDSYEINPLVDYYYDSYRNDGKAYSAFLNAYGEIKILPELTYRINLGTTLRVSTSKYFTGYWSIATNKGLPRASVDDNINNFNIYESTLTYNKTFGQDHTLVVTAVQGVQTSRTETTGANVQDIPYEASRYHNIGTANTVSSVSSSLEEWALLSYVGRINYSFKSKYLASVSLRYDGASQLAEGHKWGAFPSASLAYRISQENFMQGTKNWLEDLKIRLSYGVTGNQGISPYLTQGTLSRTTYAFNEANGFGYRPLTFANKALRWESTAVYNLGIDFAFLKGRISGNLDLYNTDTYDLLMYRKLPITTGFDQVMENVGKTNNKGFEIGLHTVNIDKSNFDWSSDFSVYSNHTKIVELYQGKVDDIGSGWFIGHPINVYYNYEKEGIWQLGEVADAAMFGESVGQIHIKDQNGDNKHNTDDRVILGDNEPDFVANLSNNLRYKNFDLSFSIYVRWGGMTSIGQFAPFAKKRYNRLAFDYWTPKNPTNDYPRPNQLYEGSGLWGDLLTYRDASYIRMSQASIGYTIPKSILNILKVTSARVYVSSENPFYWTKCELREFNMKPDWSGTSVTTWPATRTIVVGLNLGF